MNTTLAMQRLKEDNTIDGILFVKTFGIDFDIEPFYKKIKEFNKNIFIIDDMCPSIQRFDCDINSSWADLKLFSSGYSKFIDLGYAGYGFVDDSFKKIFEDKSQTKEFLEYKNTILQKIPKMIQHKKELNEIYSNNIPNQYHLGNQYSNWRFSIMVENKQQILDEIFSIDGLFASSHYPQVDFDYVKNPKKNTNSDKIHNKIINLFNDFRYDKEKAYKTIDIINKLI
jgi:dTDP-4-amino-4,6-dideoxygalactose transaminase